jgi:hypothetical protein
MREKISCINDANNKKTVMRKYENGYWEKINYWANTLKEAVGREDLEMVEKAVPKLYYFTQQQRNKYEK